MSLIDLPSKLWMPTTGPNSYHDLKNSLSNTHLLHDENLKFAEDILSHYADFSKPKTGAGVNKPIFCLSEFQEGKTECALLTVLEFVNKYYDRTNKDTIVVYWLINISDKEIYHQTVKRIGNFCSEVNRFLLTASLKETFTFETASHKQDRGEIHFIIAHRGQYPKLTKSLPVGFASTPHNNLKTIVVCDEIHSDTSHINNQFPKLMKKFNIDLSNLETSLTNHPLNLFFVGLSATPFALVVSDAQQIDQYTNQLHQSLKFKVIRPTNSTYLSLHAFAGSYKIKMRENAATIVSYELAENTQGLYFPKETPSLLLKRIVEILNEGLIPLIIDKNKKSNNNLDKNIKALESDIKKYNSEQGSSSNFVNNVYKNLSFNPEKKEDLAASDIITLLKPLIGKSLSKIMANIYLIHADNNFDSKTFKKLFYSNGLNTKFGLIDQTMINFWLQEKITELKDNNYARLNPSTSTASTAPKVSSQLILRINNDLSLVGTIQDWLKNQNYKIQIELYNADKKNIKDLNDEISKYTNTIPRIICIQKSLSAGKTIDCIDSVFGFIHSENSKGDAAGQAIGRLCGHNRKYQTQAANKLLPMIYGPLKEISKLLNFYKDGNIFSYIHSRSNLLAMNVHNMYKLGGFPDGTGYGSRTANGYIFKYVYFKKDQNAFLAAVNKTIRNKHMANLRVGSSLGFQQISKLNKFNLASAVLNKFKLIINPGFEGSQVGNVLGIELDQANKHFPPHSYNDLISYLQNPYVINHIISASKTTAHATDDCIEIFDGTNFIPFGDPSIDKNLANLLNNFCQRVGKDPLFIEIYPQPSKHLKHKLNNNSPLRP